MMMMMMMDFLDTSALSAIEMLHEILLHKFIIDNGTDNMQILTISPLFCTYLTLCRQDVFTVSVGNLPPRCMAVIKITYVAELVVDGDHISFRVPGSVAPWTQKSALDSETQSTVRTVKVEDGGEVSVQVAVEMPFDIRSITSPTHRLRIKVAASDLASLSCEHLTVTFLEVVGFFPTFYCSSFLNAAVKNH